MLRHAGRVAGHSFRFLHILAELLLGLVVLLGLGAGALAWRLSQGPIDLPWLTHRLEAAANSQGSPIQLHLTDAALAWEGFNRGVNEPLDIRLSDVRAADDAGRTIVAAPKVEISLAVGALLFGRIAPRAVEIDGARITVLRASDGTLSLDRSGGPGSDANVSPATGGTPSLADLITELSQPAQNDTGNVRRGAGPFRLNQLRRVLIRHDEVTADDRQLGVTWHASDVAIDLKRQLQGGVAGHADIQLAIGDATARLTADATLEQGGRATHLQAGLSEIAPAALARAIPSLAPIAMLDAPVTLDGTADLGPALTLQHFGLHAQTGRGTIHLGSGTVPLSAIDLAFNGTTQNVTLSRLQVLLAPSGNGKGPELDGTGSLSRQAGRVKLQLALALDQVAFADLGRYWPEGIGGPGSRKWLVQNITSGTATDGHANLTLDSSEDFSDVTLTAASGGISGQDLTIHWLQPVPPIEHAQATLTITKPDEIVITAQNGREGALTIRDGTMRIWGLTTKDQFADLALHITGPLADALTLLKHPRLKLLSRRNLDLRDPTGSQETNLSVQLPLEAKVKIEQIAIRAQSKLTDVHLTGIAGGKDLDDGSLSLDAGNDGMKLTGQALLAGIPSQLSAEMDFRSGPPTEALTRANISGQATVQQLSAAGIDTLGLLQSGTAGLDVGYIQQRNGHANLNLHADLQGAALDGGPIAWTKLAGLPATVSAQIVLDHDRVIGVSDLAAEAPGLLVRGRAHFINGQPASLRLDRVVIGKTNLDGDIRFAEQAGEPIRISVTGTQLDLSSRLSRHGHAAQSTSGAEKQGPPWSVQGSFQRVFLASQTGLNNVRFSATSNGRVIRQAQLDSAAPESVHVVITPDGTNTRGLSVTAADAGALLRALDTFHNMRGGTLVLAGRFDDSRPHNPVSGTAEITGARIADAPAIAKVLQAMTLYGLMDAVRGPGMAVNRLIAPFRLDGDLLDISEARAFNPSLGVTVQGQIDLARDTASLEGTIVPAYMINSFLGDIPVIGKLFSPEKGGGLFAATYTVRGSLDDPSVMVNPLAALAPGFLRGLFGAFK